MTPSPLPLIAILRGITPDEVRAHVRVLIDAGISQIEIPTNSPHWLDSVQLALQEADGHAEVGAGTVLDIADGDRLADSGARLMVTPNTNPVVIALSIVLAIQQQAGGNLSEALGNLSGVLRDRLRLQLKVKALSAEAKASA